MVILISGLFLKIPPHCSPRQPFLTMHFQLRGVFNSSKVLLLQPIAAHYFKVILVRECNSSKVLPLQPIAAHSYDAIVVEGGI